MARWRLTEPHYLYTDPDTLWERIETDTETGRQVRKQYVVPAYFHHEMISDWTDKVEKAVIVANRFDKAHKTDIVFKGEPTPGMMALDDEAEAISAKFKDKWNLPDHIKWGDGQYSSALADHFAEQIDKVNMRATQMAEQNSRNVEEYMKAQGLQSSQIIKILEMLATKATGEPDATRSTESDNQRPAAASAAGGRRF